MGIDWYSCKHCGETFPDCGDYVYCDCGKCWCSDECAEADGFQRDNCSMNYDVIDGYEQNGECEQGTHGGCESCDYYTKGGCKYCRHEDFDDGELLGFALKGLEMSRSDLIEAYKLKKNNKQNN